MGEKRKLRKRVEALEDMIKHAWVHTAYKDCGYGQMTTEQKRLYREIVGRTEAEQDEEHGWTTTTKHGDQVRHEGDPDFERWLTEAYYSK